MSAGSEGGGGGGGGGGRGHRRRNPGAGEPSRRNARRGGGGHGQSNEERKRNNYQAWGVGVAVGTGRSTNYNADDNNRSTDNSREVQDNQRRTQQQNKYERKGPVFGFKRMHGFLSSSDCNGTVLSIHRDKEHWENFLTSADLKPKSDLLALVAQVLGRQVCSEDVSLAQLQLELLAMTFVEKFRIKILEQCTAICMGAISGGTSASRLTYPNRENQLEVDSSPLAFLSSIHQYCSFVIKKMPEAALDFLSQLVASAFGAISSIAEGSGDSDLMTLRSEYVKLKSEISELMKRKEAQMALKSQKFNQNHMTDEFIQELHAIDAPEDYRSIPIIPTAQELLSKEETFLRPNIVRGSYRSAHHYLDTQFRLLREDFLRPLKNGVQNFNQFKNEYLSGKKRMPMGEVRIYPDVQIVNAELIRDECVYKVQLPEQMYKKIKWDKSKRLLTGSLLAFTKPPNYFRETYFAIVASRRIEDLSKGLLSLTWQGERQPTWDKNEEYLMVECEVYFESYRHTLHTLQNLELESFPMSKFIVEGSRDVAPPAYLEELRGMIGVKLSDNNTYSFSPLIRNNWPSSEQLGLDINQYEALRAALTTQFAIIQGPPGTGKTFLGLKIAEILLSNEAAWKKPSDEPIFVVCYTNHALDQFLEGILAILEAQAKEAGEKDKFNQSCMMVRVGGRSKSEAMQKFSLANVLRNQSMLRKMPRDYHASVYKATSDVNNLKDSRSTMMSTFMGFKDVQGIVDFKDVDPEIMNLLHVDFPSSSTIWESFSNMEWFGFNDVTLSRQNKPEDILRKWFQIRPATSGRKVKVSQKPQPTQQQEDRAEGDDDDDEDYDVEELLADRDFDNILAEAESQAGAATASFAMGQHIKYIAGFSLRDIENNMKNIDEEIATLAIKHAWEQIAGLEETKQTALRRKALLGEIFRLYHEDRLELPNMRPFIESLNGNAAPGINSINSLRMAQRWALYFEVVGRARNLCAAKVHDIEEQLRVEQQKLHQIRRFGEGHVLKGSKVVGMTTTGAAKYNDLVKMMESKIVIVEEAAEVLESHIVTCITKHCQHLILIGDHRQLRPNTTVYDLAKRFNLDISLFERMINNNLNCHQLKVQHRMRPEIADLVVDTIYKELQNHISVFVYPKVKGITENLYFFSHTELEKSDSDSMSKSNQFEAGFLASLCRYIILQGYQPHQITVLTTYTGQMFLLKKVFRSVPNCQGVRITCVDNFQGEENDIILLSLVRSNSESKIGFLSVDNRVCVALSRAKQGLYIVGNMNMMAEKSRIWSQIRDKLSRAGRIGSSLNLECQIHGTVTEVNKEEDFRTKAPEGGCHLPCGAKLSCSHKCNKVCHTLDTEHKNYRCQYPCLLFCPNNHDCTGQCFKKPCPPCEIRIQKTLFCGHVTTAECWKEESSITCSEVVEKTLPCGHKENMPCHKNPNEKICRIEVEKVMPCSHRRTVQCHVDALSLTCKILVAKSLPCGHTQDAECRFHPEVIKCETMVEKRFTDCQHSREVICSKRNETVVCLAPCQVRLNCGHACTRLCHVNDDPDHKNYICKKECSRTCPSDAAHTCEQKHKCHTACPPCPVEVERTLARCGHKGRMPCHIDPSTYECKKQCTRRLTCYHTCQKLCFEACGPCSVQVKKRINECKHVIEIRCDLHPSRDFCEVMVPPVKDAACGHPNVLVPCKISLTASSKEIMRKYCNHPCRTTFAEENGGCGHTCSGTCQSCMQGRLHEKCKSQCGKSLVCGHVCEFPCSKFCPPCGKDCMMKCEHSVCKQKCGTPCQDCNEKCPWQCKHKQCSKLCKEMCDREPCDIPCEKKLKCGHSCIGYCGEPCPPQCRVCDKEELTEFILYGFEEEEDSRFIYLPECGHAIESQGLHNYMKLREEGEEIGIKKCPRCSTIIKHCRRFNNIIKSRLNDVVLVKQRIFGDQKRVLELQSALIAKLRFESEKMMDCLPAVHDYLLDLIANPIPVKRESNKNRYIRKTVDEYSMNSINSLYNFAEEAVKVIKKSKLRPELYNNLVRRYEKLFENMMARQLPLGALELRDFSFELDRLFDLEQAYARRSAPQFGDIHARAQPIYDQSLKLILSSKPYTHEDKGRLRELFHKLEDVLRTGLGVSDAERREIISALGMRQGHWYKCPNGHIYVITECGGANQVGKCNECGATIGGVNHTLERNNALATEMDGATGPAWPTMLFR